MATCYNCKEPLVQVFKIESRRKDDNPNMVDALRITLGGGYGEYVDGHMAVIICKRCADNLRLSAPFIGKIMKEIEEGELVF